MTALLVSEYRKFTSTRLWWVLLIIMAVYMGMTAGGLAFSYTMSPSQSGPPMDPSRVPELVYTTAASLGYAFPALIGVLAFAGEFRHKTISPTFLATPNRTKVVLAKMVSALPMGFIYGLAGTAASVLAGAAILKLNNLDPLLGHGHTWEIIARSVLALTVWLVVGVALGALLTNQVAAIVTLLVFTQFIEPIARITLATTSWGENVAKFLPGSAGDAIAGGSLYSAMSTGTLLPMWGGVAVLLGYAAFFAIIGRATVLSRDIG